MNQVLARGASPSGPGRATHAKAYQRNYPLVWWARNPRYLTYMVREASSVSLALWLLLMLRQLDQLRKGPEAYARFVRRLRSPFWLLFNIVNLGLALLHSYTWLSLTAQVLPVPQGLPRPAPETMRRGLFGTWALISLAVALPFLFGGFFRGRKR
jgi:fumarate reductase subunit C